MPQLDYITFKIQIIGTIISFFSIFLLTIWIFLPFFFINIKLKFTIFCYFNQQKNKLKLYIKKSFNSFLYLYGYNLNKIIILFKLYKIKIILKNKIINYLIFDFLSSNLLINYYKKRIILNNLANFIINQNNFNINNNENNLLKKNNLSIIYIWLYIK